MEIWLLRVTTETMITLGSIAWAAYHSERLLTKLGEVIVRLMRKKS